ncbi:MAG TPA: hypothetical protein VFA41_09355 [Ktedonobacteraceae bacterium]|jgi:hypothetical protein|nr:hypothetical protein [Ktedonobacteraceae bacterium]
MGFWPSTHHTCPYDDEEAILLVDVETESVPVTDEDGNPMYYCLEGEHTFSVDSDDWEGGDTYSRR